MTNNKLCRLCVTNSEAYKSLYDYDGQKNEVYQLMVKFFDATLLNMDQGTSLTCMCLKCWRTIFDFHHFQQSVVEAQKKLLKGDCHLEEVNVKPEVMDSTEECTLPQIEEVPVKSGLCNQNNNDNGQHEQSKSFILPKLEIIDVFSGDDSTLDSDDMLDGTASTLIGSEFLTESDDDGQLSLDGNELIEKEDNGNHSGIKGNIKTPARKEAELGIKSRIDDFIANWRPNLECVVCLQLYPSFSVLRQHFRQNHSQDEFYILCCRRKLKNLLKITEHIRFHSGPNAMKCDLCNKSFTARPSLDRHMDIYHAVPNERNSVPNVDSTDNIHTTKTSSKKQTGRRTVQDIDEAIAKWMPLLKCVICSDTRPTFSRLQRHFHKEHPDEQCYIQCCKRKFKSRSYIADHVRHHIDPNTYKCEICLKTFCVRSSLLRHMSTHDDSAIANHNKILRNATPKDDFIAQWNSNLECVVCNDTAPTFTLLRQHFQVKHPLAEFYILCCQRKLKDRHHIKEHVLLHIDPNSFKCELCNRCFNTRSHLLRHMRTYHPIFDDGIRKIPEGPRRTTKELDDAISQWKPNLECVHCRVTCPSFALLQEHFRQEHPQEECVLVCCQRKLKDRYRIIDHIRVHNDPNAYKCDLCNKCFSTRSNLFYHMRSHQTSLNADDS